MVDGNRHGIRNPYILDVYGRPPLKTLVLHKFLSRTHTKSFCCHFQEEKKPFLLSLPPRAFATKLFTTVINATP
jgi:hypothetical protein